MTLPDRFPRPILVSTFTRQSTLRPLMETIRMVKPERLFLSSDGARPDRPGEAEQVAATREMALSMIDWDCEVTTLFRDENLGCKHAIASSVCWFFENVESGIVFEDDVLPNLDFFRYCDELLTRYEHDERVMHIGGSTVTDFGPTRDSYYFTRYPMIWGFASWKRAWSQYTLDAPPAEDLERMVAAFGTAKERAYWKSLLEWYYDGGMDTWDYPWAATIWRAGGISISTTTNMVSNTGFGVQSTNTHAWKDFRGLGNRPRSDIGEIRHPDKVEIDDELDYKVFIDAYERPPLPIHALKILRHVARLRIASLRGRLDPTPALAGPVSPVLPGGAEAPMPPSTDLPEDKETG